MVGRVEQSCCSNLMCMSRPHNVYQAYLHMQFKDFHSIKHIFASVRHLQVLLCTISISLNNRQIASSLSRIYRVRKPGELHRPCEHVSFPSQSPHFKPSVCHSSN